MEFAVRKGKERNCKQGEKKNYHSPLCDVKAQLATVVQNKNSSLSGSAEFLICIKQIRDRPQIHEEFVVH